MAAPRPRLLARRATLLALSAGPRLVLGPAGRHRLAHWPPPRQRRSRAPARSARSPASRSSGSTRSLPRPPTARRPRSRCSSRSAPAASPTSAPSARPLIIAILEIVYFSYRQTIHAYPGGGGSYTVAKENLGTRAALLAGSALALDYVLNVAVGISAGVGALVVRGPVAPALTRCRSASRSSSSSRWSTCAGSGSRASRSCSRRTRSSRRSASPSRWASPGR